VDVVRPDVAKVLARLKDFQRATVDYVFHRMYLDPSPTRRFLVADEVGLGKTLVARGVIARTIDRLWDEGVERIDVIYICSNADIARQNINRLNVTGQEDFALASRITMLPVTLKDLKKNRLNFVSFTPGTSFDLKSSKGMKKERALLYWLLQQAWNLKGAAPLNVLQGDASRDNFRRLVDEFSDRVGEIDEGLEEDFRRAILRDCEVARREDRPDIRTRFDSLCERFGRSKDNIPAEDAQERTAVIAELRSLLAATCLEALEPDLIILDEFQRFKHLLEGRDAAGDLARKLFEFPDNRILLLSATPYKMYTLDDESDEDHYADFLRTLGFLLGGEIGDFAELLRDYRREIFSLAGGQVGPLRKLKQEIESRLRQVMVRTERLAVSEDRNGMLVQVKSEARLDAQDVSGYLDLQRVSRVLETQDSLEYWKAAPYLLNFMDDYVLKRRFDEGASDARLGGELAEALGGQVGTLLAWDDIVRYKAVDPGNARLRALWSNTVGRKLWRLLWIPPSLPYYQLADPYSSADGVTKQLVFSSWAVVPKVIASLLSYGAEQSMFVSQEPEPENTAEARKRRRGLLRFARADMRLTGMPVLGVLYPSHALARACDPLRLAQEQGMNGQTPALDDVVAAAEKKVGSLLERVRTELNHRVFDLGEGGPPDESWYWAAPILFDCLEALTPTRSWLEREDCASRWAGQDTAEEDGDGDESAWEDHVQTARKAAGAGLTALILGTMPPDLARIMALVGLAGPGVAALRALGRLSRDEAILRDPDVRDAAGSVAWAFRGLFNIPEVMALVRGLNPDEPYWARVVDYCVAGGLQAVLDEYVHILQEGLGLLDKTPADTARLVADEIRSALSIRTVALGLDVVEVGDTIRMIPQKLRARFALRFGDDQAEDGAAANRAEQVRTAFNSPFWPFVLASTSVGQEGLDFHCYCHAVVHWNLPANPVDLEQREGRVHRYKGHAVRKNVARHFGLGAANGNGGDPWQALFEAARHARGTASDISPYWVFALPDGAVIERHVPTLPLSRDLNRLLELRKALALYRMVFGQARQEELVSYLLTQVPEPMVRAATDELRIDLSPPPPPHGGN
jgi:hypothetical protein